VSTHWDDGLHLTANGFGQERRVYTYIRGASCMGGRYHGRVITLGIDPGTAVCGFGVVELRDGAVRLVDAGCVRTPADASDGERLLQLHEALRSLIVEHRPERVGIERLFFQRNVQTAMAVGQARGIALLAAAEAALPIDEPTPNEVKQTICGNGAADKAQVAAMVQRLLGVSFAGVPDDATDALAIAIGCAYRAASEPRVAVR
jgi:crossover junction endodeoxyribonuclease RuvC